MKTKTLEQWLIPKLRRLSIQWPERNKALNRVKEKVQIGFFKNKKPKFKVKFRCEHCSELFLKNEVEVDHKVAIHKSDGLESYLRNLFCTSEFLQVLCKKVCHLKKTKKDIYD